MNTQNIFKAFRKSAYAAIALTFSVLTGVSTTAYADDTDVFLGSASSATTATRPNILFIIDTSGSMDAKDIPDQPGKSRLDVLKESFIGILDNINNVNVGLMTYNSAGGPVRYPIGYIDGDASLYETGGFNVNTPVQASSDDAEQNINTIINPDSVRLDDSYLHMSEAFDATNPTVVTFTVASDNQDVEENILNGNITTTSNDLDAALDTDLALVFTNFSVPYNATIISAELIMTIDPDNSNDDQVGLDETSTANLLISGIAETSVSVPFPNAPYTVSSLPRTVQTQAWNNVPVADFGTTVTSSNLSLVIQEIVSQPGWVEGNNLGLVITTTLGYRDFESRNGGATNAPKLRISYTLDPTRVPKLMGLRFQDVRIPQGAEIRRAFIEFSAASDSSDPVEYAISAENAADTTTFTTVNDNIGSRTLTTSSVPWVLTAAEKWEADERYSTPDIKNVIQEIVDRGDWCGGNDLSLILEPKLGSSAARMIRSYEGVIGTYAEAPTLRIEFDTNTANISAPKTGCILSQVSARVNSSTSDAEQQSNNAVSTGSSDLELVQDGSSNVQKVGIRFINLDIPQGATVKSAYVYFTADGSTTSSTSLTIRGHKVANSGPFGGNSDISNRINNASTTASVPWSSVPSWTDNGVYSSPDIGPVVQEIVNQASWAPNNSLSLLLTGSGTRRASSYDGNAAQAPRLVVNVELNLAGIPSTSAQTVRQRLIQEVDNLRTVGATPTVNVFMEAIRYFKGMPSYWGKVRGAQTGNDRYGRVSHKGSYTGGTVSQPAGCTDAYLNDFDCIDEIVTGSPEYISPITDGCQANYIVLLSDGFQNSYRSDDDIPGLLATAPAGSGFPSTCDTNNGGADCGLKLAEFAHRFDLIPSMGGTQSINKLFTIGFSFSGTFLPELAAAGGGTYKTANTAAELIEAFNAFLSDILSRPTTFVAPTLTISAFNRLFNSNEIYISIFEPQRTVKWSGNVKKYFLCTPAQDDSGVCTLGQLLDANDMPAVDDGQIKSTAVSGWSGVEDGPDVEIGGAGMQVPPYGSRRIYTYTGTSSSLDHATNLVTTANTAITAGMLGVAAAERDPLINWIRGQDIKDENGNSVFSENRWTFGDPLHSAATTINYGKEGTTPITKLFVGTNDGGFRMINTETGVEEWIFIPQEVLPIMDGLSDNLNGDHAYGMDGSPVAWISDANGDSTIDPSTDFVKMFIGQRRGGNNYYALNVTPTSTLTSATTTGGIVPQLLWQINSSTTGYSRLTQSWSKPFRTRIMMNESGNTVRKDVVIFGGGYDPANDANYGPLITGAEAGNAIYIADAATGELIWAASGNTGATLVVPGMDYSIPSDIRMLDMDGNNATDRLYVGDVAGQVWRVDLGVVTKNSNDNIVVGKLASLGDTSLTSLPEDRRRFMYRPQVALLKDTEFANGEHVAIALNSGDREDPLNDDVHDRVYVLRDYQLSTMPDDTGDYLADSGYATITNADLYDATLDITSVGNVPSMKSGGGWYINLKESSGFIGEKGITEGQILISSKPADPPVYTFNTYIPNMSSASSACGVSLGANRTYFINLLNSNATTIIAGNVRATYNDAFGIAADPTVVQQEGQSSVSVGAGSTYNEVPYNVDLGDNLLPIYMSE